MRSLRISRGGVATTVGTGSYERDVREQLTLGALVKRALENGAEFDSPIFIAPLDRPSDGNESFFIKRISVDEKENWGITTADVILLNIEGE